MHATLWHWLGFNLFVAAMLTIDLGVVRRRAAAVTPKEAIGWTLIWIACSLGFAGYIWHHGGYEPAVAYLTGYVVEYALSVDNLFVFLVVFSYFRIAPELRHRLLFWGIIGAVLLRAGLILVGTALVTRFHWVLYIFGAFLLFTAWKMATSDEEEVDPSQNAVLRFARKILPVSKLDQGGKFFTREHGRFVVTPLFLVLLVVETTDLIFALDSIPAVMGITQDPFIVYTSNVAAILGLRSLFFVVASLMDKFHYLKVGLSVVLAFVGVKMLISGFYEIHELVSLGVIFAVLAVSIGVSMARPRVDEPPAGPSGG